MIPPLDYYTISSGSVFQYAQAQPLIHGGELSLLPSFILSPIPFPFFHFFSTLAPFHPFPCLSCTSQDLLCLSEGSLGTLYSQSSAYPPPPCIPFPAPGRPFDPCILLSTTVVSCLRSPYSELLLQPCLQAGHHGNKLSLFYCEQKMAVGRKSS